MSAAKVTSDRKNRHDLQRLWIDDHQFISDADANGNLYGTTEEGGGPECLGRGCGVVFKV